MEIYGVRIIFFCTIAISKKIKIQLVDGLVPWFFFSEAWISATNSMMEYSYLVKKVVFKISVSTELYNKRNGSIF